MAWKREKMNYLLLAVFQKLFYETWTEVEKEIFKIQIKYSTVYKSKGR